MMITINQQRQIAAFLIRDCSNAERHRALLGSEFGPLDIDPACRREILQRWGASCKPLIEDIAYNDSLLDPWALAFEADEPVKLRQLLATAFLEAIWPDIEGWLSEAAAQYYIDAQTAEQVADGLDRRIA